MKIGLRQCRGMESTIHITVDRLTEKEDTMRDINTIPLDALFDERRQIFDSFTEDDDHDIDEVIRNVGHYGYDQELQDASVFPGGPPAKKQRRRRR